MDGMAPALEREEPVDLHREFALALPMLVLAELFGMPQDDMFGLAAVINPILKAWARTPATPSSPRRTRPAPGCRPTSATSYSVSAPIPATTSCRCWSAHTMTMPTRCRMRS
ncbi:hypothetical protein ACVWW4_004247 [Bradyrhizobium sp. LB7.1]